jgi:hypothetical protein
MNTGIQDAVNLGWKLAFGACSTDPDALLDSYDLERRPAASRLLWLTHLAFWLEASTGRAPSLLRAAAPAAAPLAPLLLGRKRLLGEGIAAMSRLRASYPAGSVVTRAAQGPRSRPRAGARLADATVTLGGSQDSLHAITASPGIHVLYCSGATPPQAIDLGPHAHLHRLDHAPFDGIVAVRPDGYIGFRGGDGSFDALAAWLREIGAT